MLYEGIVYLEDIKWMTGEGKGVLEAYFASQLFGYESLEVDWERHGKSEDTPGAGPLDVSAASDQGLILSEMDMACLFISFPLRA